MKKIPFPVLLKEAWQATFSQKTPWVFGFFIATASVLVQMFNRDLISLQIQSFEDLFRFITEKTPEEITLACLFLLALFLVHSFGTGNLIKSLSFLIKKPSALHSLFSFHFLWKNFSLTLIIECVFFFLILFLLGIFSLPFFVASQINPAVIPLLQSLAFFLFLPLLLILSLLKRFSLFYALFSSLRLRVVFETASLLLSRFFSASLLFFFFTLILTLLFTFLVNIAILTSTVLVEQNILPFTEFSVRFFLSLLFFSWFSVFENALWIAFFKSLASPRVTKKITKGEESLIEENVLVETPFV
ncbi:MAG: hypothetical protein PHH40_03725 [Candidatus Moranbacteria bacterium]|nr:hypothetical protein [Candidatus Moranbacteria bacterium]MDD3964642.1 hypothetical protein [Candidatus Moranbacteria bacterium]